MARDRLAAIRERRAQGLADPPSPPRRSPSPGYRLDYDFATARDSPVSAPPDSPRDFNPFARFESAPAPATPSPRSSRQFPAPKAPTGWFSGFGWAWNTAGSATNSSPPQPSLDYGQRNLPPTPIENSDTPVLGYGEPPVATEAIAPLAIPEALIPQDFDPNNIGRPARPSPRFPPPDRLESPRSSVILSPSYQVDPNLPPPAASTASPKKTRKRRVSIVPISPRRSSTATIIEEDFVEEKGGSREDAARGVTNPDALGRPRISKGDVPYEDMPSFFEQITDLQQEVRRAHSLIQIIGSLRDRLLAIPSADSPVAIEVREDLDGQTTAARSLFTSIQTRLHELEQGNANLRVLIPAGQSSYDLSLHDVDIRQQQVSLLKERFKEVIQRYAAAEQEHRAKQRVRLERQIRVVNPSLPPEEMKEVIDRAEAGENPAIFAQATTGIRSQAARGALREVQNRAAELARIEQTLIELAQLFQDMAIMVEAQDVLIAEIEQTAATVNHDMEKGVEQVQVAVKHARNARKWRWVCCAITTIILVIVAVVLCAVLIPPALRARRNNSSPP